MFSICPVCPTEPEKLPPRYWACRVTKQSLARGAVHLTLGDTQELIVLSCHQCGLTSQRCPPGAQRSHARETSGEVTAHKSFPWELLSNADGQVWFGKVFEMLGPSPWFPISVWFYRIQVNVFSYVETYSSGCFFIILSWENVYAASTAESRYYFR